MLGPHFPYIKSVAENLRAKAEKDKAHKSAKSPQKRSFLDRVINRKESMKKDDKKPKSATPSAPSSPTILSNVEPELPCYDDVSNLTAVRESMMSTGVDEEDYLSPPPPRPIYSRPPTIIKCAVPSDEIYDDIGSGAEVNGNGCRGCANVDVIKDYPSEFLIEFLVMKQVLVECLFRRNEALNK